MIVLKNPCHPCGGAHFLSRRGVVPVLCGECSMRGQLCGAAPVGHGAAHRRPDARRGCVSCASVPPFPLWYPGNH